jgi:transposase
MHYVQKTTLSDEFMLDAIRLVKEQGYTRSEAARNPGIEPEILGRWIVEQDRNQADLKPGKPAGVLQDEVKHLREEKSKLKMEREVLVKAVALFVKEWKRRPEVGLIFHSDRGVQYASHEFQRLLKANGILGSMSRKGD